MVKADYISAASLLEPWEQSIASGEGPVVYRHSFPVPEISPGSIVLVGGAPGSGKTALIMNVVVEMLRFTPSLKVLVVNVEMSPNALLDRQLARLSGIDGQTIRHRRFTKEHDERLGAGIATIRSFSDRIAFLRPPFDLNNVAVSADEFGADVIVLDYIQRIRSAQGDGEARAGMNRVMDDLRKFTSAGVAVIVLSAVGRSKDNKGRTSYAGADLSLGSFRESSELEFGADDAFILAPASSKGGNLMRLSHLKCRHGAIQSLDLDFDRAHQSFTIPGKGAENPVGTELADLFNATEAAADDDARGAVK